jgi:type I restriction enzyme M protein
LVAVSHAEVEENEFNLNLPRYIDTTEPEDLHDIAAHLHGGIPERDIDDLSRYWDVFPGLKADLFVPSYRSGYYELIMDNGQLTEEREQLSTINSQLSIKDHPEFVAYTEAIMSIFDEWRAVHRPQLMSLSADDSPQDLIETLAEAHPRPLRLKFCVFQESSYT